jgi:hypothetical protein
MKNMKIELYVALDEEYVSTAEFQDVYEQAGRARAAIRGFINYLKKYPTRTNTEPLTRRTVVALNL